MITYQAPMNYYKFNEDGEPTRSDFLFSDQISSRNFCFHSQGVELLRLDKDGMIFSGQRITDAGEAYAAWMKTMGMMQGGHAQKPLSEDSIDKAYDDMCHVDSWSDFREGVRWAEKAHGIGETE